MDNNNANVNVNAGQTALSVAPQTPDKDRGKVTYQVAGHDVMLSYKIVRDFLTRGNGTVTDAELTQFISICKFNQLNPFLNEAYLVKFGGQHESAQMIVSKEALMKRAEQCPEYDGFQAGLIIDRQGEFMDIEGSFTLPTDTLLGGWAVVYRKDRKYPVVSRVSIAEYDKKQSTWNSKKYTMIRKTAIVQAMREAFPTQLGAMYTAEEQDIQDVSYEEVKPKQLRQHELLPDDVKNELSERLSKCSSADEIDSLFDTLDDTLKSNHFANKLFAAQKATVNAGVSKTGSTADSGGNASAPANQQSSKPSLL